MSTVQQPALKRTDSGIAIEDSPSPKPIAADLQSAPTSDCNVLLSEAIRTRHSTRLFLPRPVPHSSLERALEAARHAPSNSNTQAWRLFIATGPALQRLTGALVHAASAGEEPSFPGLPPSFAPYRSALGAQVYGKEGWGLARDDMEGRKAATLRNFDFFGAPVVVVVGMSTELEGEEALSVGMYVQTLLLALTAQGLGSCVEIAIAGYPEIVRREMGIPEDMRILCGIAVGYEDTSARVNGIRSKREGVDKTTVWVNE